MLGTVLGAPAAERVAAAAKQVVARGLRNAALVALAGLAVLGLRAFLAARARPAKASRPPAAPPGQGAQDLAGAPGPMNVVTLALALGIAAGRNLPRS